MRLEVVDSPDDKVHPQHPTERTHTKRHLGAAPSDRAALVTRLGVDCDEGHGRWWSESDVRTKVW